MFAILFAAHAFVAFPACDADTRRIVQAWNHNHGHASPELQFLQSDNPGVPGDFGSMHLVWKYNVKTGQPVDRFATTSSDTVMADCVGASSTAFMHLFPSAQGDGQACKLAWATSAHSGKTIAVKIKSSRLKVVQVYQGLGNDADGRGLCDFQ